MLATSQCDHPWCHSEGIFVHRWKDADSGEVIITWHYCAEHNYPRYPNKRRSRFREKDGSLTTYVRSVKYDVH